jgi:hypothetical protein
MQLAGKQFARTYRRMCGILEFEERVHMGFAAGQIPRFVRAHTSTNRGHGLSLEKGTEP